MYTLQGLENGIEGCKKNITVLETAIETERQTIKNYRVMMDDVERADKLKAEAEAGITIEVE